MTESYVSVPMVSTSDRSPSTPRARVAQNNSKAIHEATEKIREETPPIMLTALSSSRSETDVHFHKNMNDKSLPTDERSEVAPMHHVFPAKPRSSAERIVAKDRKIASIHNRLFTDHANLCAFGLQQGLGEQDLSYCQFSKYMLSRSVSLLLLVKDLGSAEIGRAEGQACLISTEDVIVMATVKHNFCTEINKRGEQEECLCAYMCTQSGAYNYNFPFDRKLIGWDAEELQEEDKFVFDTKDPSKKWKYGHELELIPLQHPKQCEDLLKAVNEDRVKPFQAVDTKFICKVGMEVGILAHSCENMLAKGLGEGLACDNNNGSEEQQRPYVARQGDTFITVGNISRVGHQHIEYDVNTVQGFAGAPVFLLQPESDHHLKVVAVHAGFSEERGSNFGFSVANKIKEFEARKDCLCCACCIM